MSGWMAVPDPLVAPLTEAKHLADRHTSVLDQLALADRTEEEVVGALAARSVRVAPLGPARHHPGSGPSGIVIGYGTPPQHGYPAAVEALVDGLADVTAH